MVVVWSPASPFVPLVSGRVDVAAEVVVVGVGERELASALAPLPVRFPGDFAVVNTFDESLAHRVEAGVDMTTSAPFDAAIAEMNGAMDEMERILARQPKPAPAPAPKR